ncbi:MAG: NADH-quinone oxidoreductase subunit A [Acidobacteria bacterium]|nr:NADH-quinone oxidoreductase subunit A [Acidobacteriota bacterium]
MLFEEYMVFTFIALGMGFVLMALAAGALIRPKRMDLDKRNTTYECGEEALGQAWYNFNPRFYLLALVFLIFDVEVVVTFPVIVALRQWTELGTGAIAFIEILLFVIILVIGLIFLWVRGDLEWFKHIIDPTPEEEV